MRTKFADLPFEYTLQWRVFYDGTLTHGMSLLLLVEEAFKIDYQPVTRL